MSRAARLLDLIQALRRRRHAVALRRQGGDGDRAPGLAGRPRLLRGDRSAGGLVRAASGLPPLALVILYVDNPTASVAFYADLFGCPPVEASPTFAMIRLPTGAGIGFWSRHTVEPGATAAGGGGELAFTAADLEAVHGDWARRGLTIAQPPTAMDFGRAFVALDPDGHRLRVFTPADR